MTTLDELEKLTQAATPGPWSYQDIGYTTSYQVQNFIEPHVAGAYDRKNATYIAALCPERVLAMIACIAAADAMRESNTRGVLIAYDALRAKLEE